MICPNLNDPTVKQEFTELKDVFGENVAYGLWQKNNGFPLDRTRSGERSWLFVDLQRLTGSRKRAMKLKSVIYTGKLRLKEPTAEEFFDEMKNSPYIEKESLGLPEQDLNISGITKHLTKVIKDGLIGPNRISGGTNIVDFTYTNPQQSYAIAHRMMTSMNEKYGYRVASLDTSHNGFTRLYINPHKDLVDAHLKRELQIHSEKAYNQEATDQLARDKESNQFINDEGDVIPYDDGDYSDYFPGTTQKTKDYEDGFANMMDFYKKYLTDTIGRIEKIKTDTSNNKSILEKSLELQELEQQKAYAKKQIALIKSDAELELSGVSIMAGEDFKRVAAIFVNPTADNLIEATKIIEFYKSFGLFGEGSQENNVLLAEVEMHPNPNERIATISRLLYPSTPTAPLEDNVRLTLEEEKRALERQIGIQKKLGGIAGEAGRLEGELRTKLQEFAHTILKAHPQFNKAFPDGLTLEEMMENVDDINWLSALFLGPDYSFSGKDSILAQVITGLFRDTLNDKDSISGKHVENMNAVEKDVKKELKKNGDTQADVYYQTDEFGNNRPYLIDKFSPAWFDMMTGLDSLHQSKMEVAYRSGKKEDFNNAYMAKFASLRDNADFLDINKIKSIKEAFPDMAQGFASDEDADIYEAELRKRLGDIAVDRLIEEQMEKYTQYHNLLSEKVMRHFIDAGLDPTDFANSYMGLSDSVKDSIDRFMKVHSPAIAADSAIAGGDGTSVNRHGERIVNETPYNIVIPKQANTHHIDKNFEKIEKNENYYKGWKALSGTFKYVNEAITDTHKKLVHNSLMALEKSVWKTLIQKDIPFMQRLKETWTALRDSYTRARTSSDTSVIPEEEADISTSKFREIRGQVTKNTDRDLELLAALLNIDSTKGFELNINMASNEVINYLADITGVTATRASIIALANGNATINLQRFVRSQNEKRIMARQNTDLFKIGKYYVTEAARTDAAKEISPILRVLKKLYEDIKKPESTVEGEQDKGAIRRIFSGKKRETRERANKRINNWFTRVVRGYSGVRPMPMGKKKYYTSEEKREMKMIDKQLANITKELAASQSTERQAALASRYDTLKQQRDDMGRRLDFAAMMGVIQSFIIFKGLAFNIKSSFINYVNGYMQSQIHDSLGYFWTPGNFDTAHAFVIGKGRKSFYRLASLNGKVNNKFKTHAQNIEVAEMLMHKVGLIQDARDEKQKAGKRLGKEEFSSKASPFYISVTAIEWRNQTADILAVMMDFKVTDVDGNSVPVFDGKEFILENVDGKLKLKEQFRTKKLADGTIVANEENIKNWESLEGKDYKKFKNISQSAVVAAQGDYSPTSGMMAKSNVWGRTLMIFKTFFPMALWTRFGKGVNLAAGVNIKEGMYRKHTALTGAIALGTIGLVTVGPVAGLIAGAMLGGLAANIGNRRKNPEVSLARENLVILKATVFKLMGMPANLIAGKRLEVFETDIAGEMEKNIDPADRKITEEDVRGMQAIMKEISFLVWIAAAKYALRAALSCDDENNYMCQTKMRAAAFIDNLTRQMFDDSSLYLSFNGMLQLIAGDYGPFIRWINTAEKTVDALDRAYAGEDLYVTGKDAGESKTLNSVLRTVLPGIFNTAEQLGSIVYHGKELNKVQDYNPDWMDRKFAPIEKRVKTKQQHLRRKMKNDLEGKFSEKRINAAVKEAHPTPGEKREQLKLKFGMRWLPYYEKWLEETDEN